MKAKAPDNVKKRMLKLQKMTDKRVDRIISGYERQLAKAYKRALTNIKSQIAAMFEKYGEAVTYGDMVTYNRLVTLESQIAKQIQELTGEAIKITTQGIKDSFQASYYGTGYTIESTAGVKLGFGQLNPDVINAAVLNPMDAIKWGDRLKEHQARLYRQVREEITQGLITGEGYVKMATRISEKTGTTLSKCIRIARTEAGRAQSTARVLAFDKSEKAADSLGYSTDRIWISTLDGRTRDTHKDMDGQKAVMHNGKKMFKLPSGVYAEAPRLSHIAAEDINCRCTTALTFDEMPVTKRRDNISKEEINYTTYNEWAKEKGINYDLGI